MESHPVLGTQPFTCVRAPSMQRKVRAAGSKAEKFSRLSHLFLNGRVLVEYTVPLTWHVGEPVLPRATLLSFKNLLSRMFFAS